MRNHTVKKVLIVDDHMIVRSGVKALIGTQDDMIVAGEAANGKEALELAVSTKPDLVLMDLVMPEMDGIQAIQELRKIDPHIKILVLTSFSEEEKVLAALMAGAMGFVLKTALPEELVDAMRQVAEGKTYLQSNILQILLQQEPLEKVEEKPQEEKKVVYLTPQEQRVLSLIARGLSNREIGDQLKIEETTVRYHVTHILTKLGLENRTQAALYAIREKLL
jgi:DNA-binding NarL/FixJ family response regulator